MGQGLWGHLRRIETGTVGRNWPKAWGRQGDQARPGSEARREARRVGAEQRDNPSARWDWRRSGTVPARAGREDGIVPARAQGQLWAPISEELRDSPGASREGGREGGTVPARGEEARGAWAQGQLWAPISEELRDS
jgi:hypothetical protein